MNIGDCLRFNLPYSILIEFTDEATTTFYLPLV